MLKIGHEAPDFALTDQHGAAQRLSAHRGRPVIVYFYPKDRTPVCTAQACAFRDAFEDFAARGVTVMGVSSDSGASHARFASRHRLPFHLLADADGAVRRLWEVPRSLGLFPGRVTFVLDDGGIVRRIINSPLNAARHVREALETIQAIRPGGGAAADPSPAALGR